VLFKVLLVYSNEGIGVTKERVSKWKNLEFFTERVVIVEAVDTDPEVKELLELEREGWFMCKASDRKEVR